MKIPSIGKTEILITALSSGERYGLYSDRVTPAAGLER
jgi:hypothetical protein